MIRDVLLCRTGELVIIPFGCRPDQGGPFSGGFSFVVALFFGVVRGVAT